MRIYIKVNPKSSQQKIKKLENGNYKVWLKAVPEKGLANRELIEFLAKYFKISKSEIKIVGGKTSSRKIVDVGGKL